MDVKLNMDLNQPPPPPRGFAKRFACIAVASRDPFTLERLQVNVYTNARGSSVTNPIVVAVEASPRDNFINFATFGTVMSYHRTPGNRGLCP